MGLETATFISGLNASNPVGVSDSKSQGDDHLRLIKTTLLNTFPNITGAMNASHTELNNLVGVTGKTGTGNLVLSASPTLTGTLTAAAITASGVITGDGSGLTALNASNLASGTIADARLSPNVPLLNAPNTFTGTEQIISAAHALLRLQDTGAALDEKIYRIRVNDGGFFLSNYNDALGFIGNIVAVQRTGQNVDSFAITADAITLIGTVGITGALTATSYGGITQANLVDKSATETIAGAWTFGADVSLSGTRAIDATTRLNLTGATVSVGESGGNLGFYGSAGTSKGTITGSRSDTGVSGALNQLLSNLESRGYLTNSSTA